jgi:hypothetical protein
MATEQTVSLSSDIALRREYLAQLQNLERRAKEEQRRISGRISSEVYGKTAGLRSTVYAATKGSNVGGDTCIRVLEQALKRLTNICNVLAEGSGPSGSSASGSFGSSSQNMIHGTDAISAKQASLVGEILRLRLMKIGLETARASLEVVKSADKDVFVEKLEGARARVDKLANAMEAYADVLAKISKSYLDAQVRAIALARDIPPLP